MLDKGEERKESSASLTDKPDVLHFRPDYDFKMGLPLEKNLIKPKRNAIEVRKMLKQAKKFYINLLSEATPEQREMLERKFDSVLKQSSELLKN